MYIKCIYICNTYIYIYYIYIYVYIHIYIIHIYIHIYLKNHSRINLLYSAIDRIYDKFP